MQIKAIYNSFWIIERESFLFLRYNALNQTIPQLNCKKKKKNEKTITYFSVELDRLNRLRETRLRKVKKKPILKPINFSTWFFVVVETN